VRVTLYLDHTLGLLLYRAVFLKDLEWTTPWGSLLQGCSRLNKVSLQQTVIELSLCSTFVMNQSGCTILKSQASRVDFSRDCVVKALINGKHVKIQCLREKNYASSTWSSLKERKLCKQQKTLLTSI